MPSLPINTTASGDNTVIAAPGAGKFINIIGFSFICTSATVVTLKAGASTNLTGPMSPGANGGVSRSSTNDPIFTLPENTAFVLNSSAAVQVAGEVQYVIRSFT